MILPSLENFKKLSKQGNLIPIYKKIKINEENPSVLLRKIQEEENIYLLESYEGPKKWSRYSFMGFNPKYIFSSFKNKIKISGINKSKQITGCPFDGLKKILKKYKPVQLKTLPRFYGGFVGFFSYEIISQIEKIPRSKKDDIKFPDCNFMFSDSLIIFDNLKKNAKVVVNVEINRKSDLNKVYSKAIKKIEQIESKLNKKAGIHPLTKCNSNHNKIKSNFKSLDFERNVKKIKDYVLRGDVIQTEIGRAHV